MTKRRSRHQDRFLPRPKLTDLDGLIRVVSEAEAEQVDWVVCVRDLPGEPRTPLAQNFGSCFGCGHPIYWANSAPKKPPKICVECALALAEQSDKSKQ